MRNAQLVEFPARLAKLELERVQLTLKAARGRRRGNGPVAFSGKTSSPPPPPPRRPAERGKCRPPCTFQGPFRGKRESSPESAELPRNRGKRLPLRNTWTEKFSARLHLRLGKFSPTALTGSDASAHFFRVVWGGRRQALVARLAAHHPFCSPSPTPPPRRNLFSFYLAAGAGGTLFSLPLITQTFREKDLS